MFISSVTAEHQSAQCDQIDTIIEVSSRQNVHIFVETRGRGWEKKKIGDSLPWKDYLSDSSEVPCN